MVDEITMNGSLFDEWQNRLFRFVRENKRNFTKAEWKWMRYQFEIEHIQTGTAEEPATALAADGDTVRVAMKDLHSYAPRKFTGDFDGHKYTITVIPRGANGNVRFDFTGENENGERVPGMIVSLAETVHLNDHGRASIPGERYAVDLRGTCGMKCSIDNGEHFFDLEIE